MWNRSELKEKAKAALKVNYWKAVLVSLIFVWIIGGASSATTSFDLSYVLDTIFEDESTDIVDEFENYEYYDYEEYDSFESMLEEEIALSLNDEEFLLGLLVIAGALVLSISIISLIAMVVSLVWAAFIANPVEMGCCRFFALSLNDKAEIKEVVRAFDTNYMNVVKILFFRTLYTMLWSMLLWIPGIIKAYEYRMIPYLLAENPNLSKEDAFDISKQMMDGNKWKAFVLDLSFFLWDMLSTATLGIVGIFYVAPYKNLTNAALFEALRQPSHVEVNPYVTPSSEE